MMSVTYPSQWFSQGNIGSFSYKTDHQDRKEILLKVVLNPKSNKILYNDGKSDHCIQVFNAVICF